jgi:hypothetical protein
VADTKRKVAISIGVGDAEQLPYLRGAINAARAFHHWADALGYEAKLIIDEHHPVTLLRLRTEIESILQPRPDGLPIHRLILFFAGHGLIREAEEGLWLLSDWYGDLRAVAVESLKRRLYMHNIEQIAIFADACRSLPRDIQIVDLVADAVLGRGPRPPQVAPPIDKFVAAQDGREAYMIPGNTPEDDRCLFSGVLLEGLWGTKPSAFSKIVAGKITSRSLGAYLQAEVPRMAQRYNRTLNPNVSPTFPEGEDIYFGDVAAVQPPTFPEWPSAAAVAGLGPTRAPGNLNVAFDFGLANATRTVLKKFGVAVDAPETTLPVRRDESAENDAAIIAQLRNQARPNSFETGSGFAVEGGPVLAVWTAPPACSERDEHEPTWWRVWDVDKYTYLRQPVPVLFEFTDEVFAAVAAVPKHIGAIQRDERGVKALIYREIYSPPEVAATAERAIAELERGALRADDARDFAVQLRQLKHVDPVLGVISAYLYDAVGDTDNIRRMACYYVQHEQTIPYDIALLAHLKTEWRNGLLWAKVPAVPKRKPGTDAEKQFSWTHERTEETEGAVAGLWPWMRQGWTYLEDFNDGSGPTVPQLIELAQHLRPARFTTLNAEGGRKLAALFNLAPNP